MLNGLIMNIKGTAVNLLGCQWSQLPNICTKEINQTDLMSRIQQLLKSLISSLKLQNDVDNKVTVLQFIYEQLSLLFAAQKRYSHRYLLVAFRLYCVSRSAYKFLRDTCLTLPHISYLCQLSRHCTENSTVQCSPMNAQNVRTLNKSAVFWLNISGFVCS